VTEYLLARTQVGGPDECWPWLLSKNGEYGQIGGGRLAHREWWASVHGPIPPGMTIHHTCYNRLCCNPAHLEMMTQSENAKRQRPKQPEFCQRGHSMADAYVTSRQRRCRTCHLDRQDRYRGVV
jgi:HNH endonuclease